MRPGGGEKNQAELGPEGRPQHQLEAVNKKEVGSHPNLCKPQT